MSEAVMPGGWSDEKPVTLEVIQICLQVRRFILEKSENHSRIFIPLKFRYQIVAGKNYLVKVYVAEDKCAHALIYQSTDGKLTVEVVQYPKTFDDPLTPPKQSASRK
ncbi:cystatin-A-like [Danio rerio]|uniref:Cystatin-A-like n=1 Tax=Danio rerio TaxID=7955 RepID=A0A8M2BFV8_DANRE